MLGKLQGKEFPVKAEELELIQQHISTNFPKYQPNELMIQRLKRALENNQLISGADASFYFHELKEAELMQQGSSYSEAHLQALQYYEVSPFSVYHPDLIQSCPDEFNNNWKKAWGI